MNAKDISVFCESGRWTVGTKISPLGYAAGSGSSYVEALAMLELCIQEQKDYPWLCGITLGCELRISTPDGSPYRYRQVVGIDKDRKQITLRMEPGKIA